MKHLSKPRIVLALTVIFIAGGVTGAMFGWGEAKQIWSRPPDTKNLCDHFRIRLESELGLSPEQVRQLGPLLEKRAKGMDAIHARTVTDIEALIRASNDEIAAVLGLSPDQRAKLEKMEKRRRRDRSSTKIGQSGEKQ